MPFVNTSIRGEPLDELITEYWSWFAVSLFLLVTVDMITTVFAARVHGVATESNPLVQWVLGRGAVALATVNLLAVVLVAAFFYALVELLRATQPQYRRPFAYLSRCSSGSSCSSAWPCSPTTSPSSCSEDRYSDREPSHCWRHVSSQKWVVCTSPSAIHVTTV